MFRLPLAWQCLTFRDLTSYQLYQILRLRQEVFAVEQNSVYLDVDGKDLDALHVLAEEDGRVLAYCRLLAPGVKYAEASIGRVVTAPEVRGTGAGRELMRQALAACQQHYPETGNRISAQLYLQTFYEGFGYEAVGEPYGEDGIPHIEMLRPAASGATA